MFLLLILLHFLLLNSKIYIIKMFKYFLFFFFLNFTLYAQTRNPLMIELDSFIKKEVKNVNKSNIVAIKKAILNIDKFNNKELTIKNIDSLYNSATSFVEKENLPGLLAWTYSKHGSYHYYLGFYNKALPYVLKSYNLIKKLDDHKIFRSVDVYQNTAYFLGEIGLHNKSIPLLKKAVEQSSTVSKNYGTFLNVIGRYYYREDNIDSAKVYFDKTLNYAIQNNDDIRKSKVLGDFALIAEDNKEYDKAEKLWLENISLSEKAGDKKHTMFAQLHLGKLYVKTKQLKKASNVISKAEEYILSKQHLQYFLYQTKEQQLKIAELTNDNKKELYTRRYLDSLKIVLEKKESSTLNKTINWEIEQQNFEQKIENQKIKLQKEQLIKWASITSLLLISLLLFSIHVSSKRKLKLKIANHEKFISDVKLQKLTSEQNLAKTKHDLLSYKTYLKEKNEQIEQLEKEIKKTQNENSTNAIHHKNELENLLESHLMTEDNWQKFKTAFINEHSSFYDNLMHENSSITETNLRIIFLHKLQLSNVEMSKLLGIGVPGVKKAKQRLRKKITEFDNL